MCYGLYFYKPEWNSEYPYSSIGFVISFPILEFLKKKQGYH